MKYLSLLIATLTVVVLTACHPVYRVPVGYTPCRTDYDCRGPSHQRGEFCGFVGVDTYAVCRR